jgi:hypothetical protein
LSGISLAPEIATRSISDATSPPSTNQEVPSVFHHVPFRFSFDPPNDPTSASAFARAYPDLPGYHIWSTWDLLTVASTSRPAGSEEEDDPDFSWDFSELRDPRALRDFVSACDHCLSSYSDDGHSLDDEGYDPSRECFHIDQEDHDKDNHLGMPRNDDASAPASRVEIPRELAEARAPAGGQGTQLEQLRKMQAKLDEETGRLMQLRQNLEQEWAGRALAGGARHRAQDIQRRIIDDARAGLPPTFNGADQNLAAAAMLLRTMPEPSTTEGRRIQGELKDLLENAAVRQAESSASRRQGCPSERHVASSRHMREASVHTEHAGDKTPAALDRLSNEQHRHDRRARLEERVRRGYHPRRGGCYDSEEDRSPSPEPPGPRVFSRAIRRAPFPARFQASTTITKYSGDRRRGRSYGSRIIGWRATWEGRTTTTSSSATSPSSSPTLPEPGWSICLLRRSSTGTT